ncbi:MAG TPA: hypothetical protein DD734_04555 [Firmicutes bacterium]|nr:hypothetical protein [Bacillota bacterium]
MIEFAPAGGLTVIVGPSDTGKTVIIRALRWLFYNQPQGMEFVRTGASFVRVTLEYESGHKVIRERTVSTNRYKIVVPGAEKPEVFEGFGNNVPLEVQEITGVSSVRIGDDNYNLNLSEQLDGPFLGAKQISSPARAKVLGKMAGTEEIDVATSEVGTDLYRRGQEEKRLEGEISKLGEDIKRFDYLPALKANIEQLQVTMDSVKAAQDRKTKLENLRFSLVTVSQSISQCDRIVERWQGVNEAENISALQEQLIQRKKTIQSHQQNLLTLEQGIKDAQDVLTQLMYLPEAEDMVVTVETLSPRLNWLKQIKINLQNVNYSLNHADNALAKWATIDEIEQAKKQVIELTEKRRNIVGLRQQLQTMDENITTVQQRAVVWEQRVAELEGAYKDALLAAGVCPTCGSEVTLESLQKAV